jgi:hypothetical protein
MDFIGDFASSAWDAALQGRLDRPILEITRPFGGY